MYLTELLLLSIVVMYAELVEELTCIVITLFSNISYG